MLNAADIRARLADRSNGHERCAGTCAAAVFKRGREVDRIIGVHPKSEIARRVERAIA